MFPSDDGRSPSDEQFTRAARYHIRRQDAAWSSADEKALQDWLAADPLHRYAWHEVRDLDALAGAAVADRRGKRLVGLGLALLSGLLFGLGWWSSASEREQPVVEAPAVTVFETGLGERRRVRLSDGSSIDLDSATRLGWLPLIDGERRLILERGRIYCAVVRNPDRPFVVQATRAEIRVLGTAFAVDQRPETVAVSVVEGAVRVDRLAVDVGPALEAVRLGPGQQALVAGRIEAGPIEPAEIGAWRGEHLVFRERPLRSVIAELRRYHPQSISVAPAIADLVLNGRIRHGPLAEQLATLATVLDLVVVPSDGGGYLLASRQAQGRHAAAEAPR